MHKVEIPIWQDPEAKPIEGFPELGPIVKYLTCAEYEEYMNPKLLDSGFNKPKPKRTIKHTGVDTGKGGRVSIVDGVVTGVEWDKEEEK